MTELREFAQHSGDLDRVGVLLVPISIDNREHAYDVWEKVAEKKFNILSDPHATVITRYGLLHKVGHAGNDIALRTTLLIGPDGREKWRRVSQSVPDIPSWHETLDMIKKSQEQRRGLDQNR